MESGKDYAYKNEISLSIGVDGVDSASGMSTPSTVTPTSPPSIPTPSPRQNLATESDTKPLTPTEDYKMPASGIENKAFDETETPVKKVEAVNNNRPLISFGNGHSNGLNDSSAANGGANKNGQLTDNKNLAGNKSVLFFVPFQMRFNFFFQMLKITIIFISIVEAVNLELININSNNNLKKPTSTNGKHNELPVKKDMDVEAGGQSYDEYFVPVNEHKKYMR